ncbi:MAG: SPOR domain-containing protein [Pseudomonadales bacterium]|jgi:cell division protein FtsN|nr:SPOR domain-containing protein [Pseudomonadales bacterium]MDP7358021.1 SPOR domain-containing protein [Pseudomonadales bacterium]MDP7595348.1 SPOR domain-containing protein [Pseudomonadales bacterium]HJN52528.1 SPOR domain-containing protein [Pseudomonadales bacterium]|tara:strand:- start:1154 stop:1648 length:495 start_codon:yes stop_codon:yes gene_type:complete
MKSQIPTWVWFLTGLVSGLFLAFLIYLSEFAPQTVPEQLAGDEPTPNTTLEVTKKKPPFQFYEIFPKNEVPIVKDPDEVKSSHATPYVLQTGSFSSVEDADRMRATLILLGLEVYTKEVMVRGELRYRVLVGPLLTDRELNQVQGKLAEAEIESIVLRLTGDGP